MISNCGHDENGKYSGGRAGDQTGSEWEIRTWYNRPWNYVFRHPEPEVQAMIAELAEEAAQNDLIGYDQNQRGTFWQQLPAAGYHPKNIKAACETDCSAGVAAIVKSVGYLTGTKALQGVSADMYTGSERAILQNAGFETLTADKYINSDRYLLRGDILLCEGHHTAINLTDGAAASTTTYRWILSGGKYYYQDQDGRNVHGWALIQETASEYKHWYYFDEKGAAVTGMQIIDGARYYFEESGPLCCALCHTSDKGVLEVWYL